MNGFLGTRGDFFSDLLILALGVVVPALGVGVWLARSRRLRAHRALMATLLAVLVLYVIVYEANLLLRGGLAFLDQVTRVARGPYYSGVAVHVAIGVAALVLGGWAARRGQRALADAAARPRHRTVAWAGVILLGLSGVTGVAVYYATFVM